MRMILPGLLAALALNACSSMPVSSCAGAARPLVQDQLYFGLSTPSGGQVGIEAWQAFLRDEVTPRFPQGLSVVEAAGQWRGNDGAIVQEESRVLTLVHADDTASETAIHAIISAYKLKFEQEAVMRLKQRACTSF